MKKFYFLSAFVFLFISLSIFACGDKECPLKGKEVLKTEEGTVKGKVVCMHCDLHKAEKCEKVLVTADNKIFKFCPDSLKDIKLDDYKGKEIEVKGKISYTKDGDNVIHIEKIN